MHFSFLLASLVLAVPVQAQQQGTTELEQRWFDDFDHALAVAKIEGKDLLVDFTGSDWSQWCVNLREEVFQFDAFYQPVAKQYVLVVLDFPDALEVRAKVPNLARNQELANQYQVGGFPTVLLMNTEGEVYAETGYQEGGAELYVTHLDQIGISGKKILVESKLLVAEYEKAKDKVSVVRKAIASLVDGASDSSPALATLAGVVRKANFLDPDNSNGLKLEALQAIFAADQAGPEDWVSAQILDPENALGLYEQAVVDQLLGVRDHATATSAVNALLKLHKLNKVQQPAQFQGMVIQAAKWCEAPDRLNRIDDARVLARWAKEIAELDPQALELLKNIL